MHLVSVSKNVLINLEIQMNGLGININNLEKALLELNEDLAEEIVFEAIKDDSAINVAGKYITEVLTKIGDSWEKGEIALSQVYMSGVICEKIIDKVLPPENPTRKNQPKIAIGVFEDYHLLGKRIVASTLRASGFELIDLGGGLAAQKVLEEVEKHKIEILMLSVLMLPSALKIKELMPELIKKDIKVIVGGAPFRFDENLAKEVGVDYCGNDSAEALAIVNQLITA